LKVCETFLLEIVVAGDGEPAKTEAIKHLANAAILLRLAVIGVVAGQEGEIHRAG